MKPPPIDNSTLGLVFIYFFFLFLFYFVVDKLIYKTKPFLKSTDHLVSAIKTRSIL